MKDEFDALLEVCVALPEEIPLVVGVDDTLARNSGARIPGVAWRRDPLGPAFQTNLVVGQLAYGQRSGKG